MRVSVLILALTAVFTAIMPAEAQVRDNRPGSSGPNRPGDDKGKCPGGGKWRPPGNCPGFRPPGCWPNWPAGCESYRGIDCAVWRSPFIYPPLYVGGPYNTSVFDSWFSNWGAAIPYYDTDPVQYAYTPIDIPPPTPVVRPARTTTSSRVLPRQLRKPLYELVAARQRPDEQN